MPFPSYFRDATLVVNGTTYRLGNVRVTDQSVEQEFGELRGGPGRVVARRAGPVVERLSFECELMEAEPVRPRYVSRSNGDMVAAVDSRDASIAAGHSAPLRVTPSQAGLTTTGTFAVPLSEPEATPTFEQIRRLTESIQRDQDRAVLSSTLLETDAEMRTRLTQHLTAAAPFATWSGSGLTAATGADLDRIAATFGIERMEATPKTQASLTKLQADYGIEPHKSALDWILEDDETEGEAA
jgi:hypothetical protein